MNVLGIFARQPLAGRVKTRLAADVGDALAAELYAAFVGDVVARFRAAGDRRLICHTPHDRAACDYFCNLAGDHYQLWPQPVGSLGDRLRLFFDHAFDSGAERVVVIGSDSPTLPVRLVDEAFQLLARHDCVIGPATDGGYYLVGQQRANRPIFGDVNWSGPSVLRQTVARVEAAGATLALLTPWYDVDSACDLDTLRGHLDALRLAGESEVAPRTAGALARLGSGPL